MMSKGVSGQGQDLQIKSSLIQKSEKAHKKQKVYASFVELGEVNDKVNGKALQHVLKMNDVDDKLLSRIKRIYVKSLTSVRVESMSENFK